jgi:hypothetical protein
MARGSRKKSTPRRPLLAATAFLLVAGLLSTGPASAHTFTKTDGDDSPGKLDIRTASVAHANNKNVVYMVRTFERWTSKSLGNDSFFIVEIDKNFDDDFEQCAFIFFAGGRLRGSLTNCRRTFIRPLSVSKPSNAVAKVTIPTSNTGGAYRWVVFSFWSGLPARCSDVCFDAAPNRPPPILHDLTPPMVVVSSDLLSVSDDATTPDFVFPFSVSDVHTNVTWSVQSRGLGETAWATVLTGSGEGDKDPAFTGVSPGQYEYRVVAIDGHGNVTNSSIRGVHVPTDVDADTGPGTSTGGVDTVDVAAYGGSYVSFNDVSDTYTINIDHPGGPCRAFTVIGPGSGTWSVAVTEGATPIDTMSAIEFPDEPRYPIYSESICADASRTFTVTLGTGFGVDAVVI